MRMGVNGLRTSFEEIVILGSQLSRRSSFVVCRSFRDIGEALAARISHSPVQRL